MDEHDYIDVNPSITQRSSSIQQSHQQPQDSEMDAHRDVAAVMVANGIRNTLFSPLFIGFVIFLVVAVIAILYYVYVLKPQMSESETQQAEQNKPYYINIADGLYVEYDKIQNYTQLIKSLQSQQSTQQSTQQQSTQQSTQQQTQQQVEEQKTETINYEELMKDIDKSIEEVDNSVE